MRFTIHKTGGGFMADRELLIFLNNLPATDRVVSVEAGRFGRWHGLDEEHEWGYKILLEHGVTDNG